jgi:hypothetical protein
MNTDCLNLVVYGVACYSIPSLTWFFSTRRRLFLCVFVPRDEIKAAFRGLPRDKAAFRRAFRTMAWLQFAVATVVLVAIFVLAVLNPR